MNGLFNPKFTITNYITDALTHIERARGFLEAGKLSDKWLAQMSKRAFFSEAHHTTHIEGTTLTEEQAKLVWEGKNIPDANPEDMKELLNYRYAYDFVSSYLDHNDRITEALIREIHKLLVAKVRGGSAAPGEYRKVQNYVVNSQSGKIIYSPPPAHEIPILMKELVEWLNTDSQIHPILISGIAQFQLVHIHPFLDGNGRTSRLLSTLSLYKTGYDFKRLFSISEHYDKDRPAFYHAIQSVRDDDMDMTTWLEYFTNGLKEQLIEITEKGKQALFFSHKTQKASLNERQSMLIEYLLIERPNVTIQEYEQLVPQTNRRTLQRDLKDLIDNGYLFETGSTHKKIYNLVPVE